MILEYIQSHTEPSKIIKDELVPGLDVYTFSTAESEQGFPSRVIPGDTSDTYEILFALDGSMILGRKNLLPVRISQKDVLLLYDTRSFQSVKINSTFKGVLLSVKKDTSSEFHSALCHLMSDFAKYLATLRNIMDKNRGCYLIKEAPVNYSIFYAMREISKEEKGRFLLLKVFELIYLIGTDSPYVHSRSNIPSKDDYLTKVIGEMYHYMEEHLDEKLTIEFMSQKFNMSPTSFKAAFKRIYGQPVHKWIQEQRFIRAGELLTCTPENIIDIAHAVGYDSMSQFNAVFKKKYGMTPCQYRKLSDTGIL